MGGANGCHLARSGPGEAGVAVELLLTDLVACQTSIGFAGTVRITFALSHLLFRRTLCTREMGGEIHRTGALSMEVGRHLRASLGCSHAVNRTADISCSAWLKTSLYGETSTSVGWIWLPLGEGTTSGEKKKTWQCSRLPEGGKL